MQYAVLYEESLSLDDGYGGRYTKKIPTYVEFANQAALLEWINMGPEYTNPKAYKIIEFQPVKIKTKIEIVRPQKTRSKPEDFDDRFRKALEIPGLQFEPVSTRLVN